MPHERAILIPGVVNSAGDRFEFDMLQRIVFGRDVRKASPFRSVRRASRLCASLPTVRSDHLRSAGLPVVDTTDDALSHFAYGIPAASIARTAFYGGMAVLPDYRGLSVPIRLIFEAQRLFVRPRGIECTWLLYPAEPRSVYTAVPHSQIQASSRYRVRTRSAEPCSYSDGAS